jgi:hypothetical protein
MENWKPIKGFDGYEVSDMGRVKNINGRIKSPNNNGRDYLTVSLRHKKRRYIHRLVADAFIGKCPDAHDVDHIDHNRKNNNLYNLQYMSISKNRSNKGELCGMTKLTEPKVRLIKHLENCRPKMTHKEIADLFGVKAPAIYKIWHGYSWKHVTI